MAMNDPHPDRPDPSDEEPFGREHRAEIIDRLYDVALDPLRLEDLIDALEGGLAPLRDRPAQGRMLEDAGLQEHLNRAIVFLDRYEATRPEGTYRSVLDDIPRVAAFICDGSQEIAACNRAARLRFGLPEAGAQFSDLPFDAEDRNTLRAVTARVASGKGEKVVTLRIRSLLSDGPVIVRVSRVASEGPRPLALVLSTELAWPEGFDLTVREAFGLTQAETEIVKALSVGQPVRDIAAARGRSQETVRTQIRSILAKTEAHSQSELVRVVLGLMDAATIPLPPAVDRGTGGTRLRRLAFNLLSLPDGRQLEWIEFGAPDGEPLLYMHLDYALLRWPDSAERATRLRGLRVIVPVRAGYGRSSPLSHSVDRTLACAEDYALVLDRLGVTRAAVLALGADLRYALQLSLLRPGLVSGIVGCAAQLPLQTPAQYERMDKWQRFVLANARYAPKVLPFVIKAGFSLARKLGKDRFLEQVNSGSPADIEIFADPEVREAILVGSDAILGPDHIAYDAFTQECISSERDWSALVHAARVPVVLLQGDQDPQTPVLTIRELMPDFPDLEVHFLAGNGQLLFFREWRRALNEAERFLNRTTRGSGDRQKVD